MQSSSPSGRTRGLYLRCALACSAMAVPLRERRWPWLLAAGMILAAFAASFVEIHLPWNRDPRARGGPEEIAALRGRRDLNLLFVLIDTLRADRLHSYGYARET